MRLDYVRVSPNGATCRIEVEKCHLQPAGIVHGGVYASLVEASSSAAGTAWLVNSGAEESFVGMENNTSFIKPVDNGIIEVRSSPVHRGFRTQIWRVEVFNDFNELVCLGQLRGQNIPRKI